MRKYTIVDYFGYALSGQDRIRAISRAGFDGVILLWADYFDPDYKKFPEYAEREGLFVENAHAPYMQANSIWDSASAGDEYASAIIECIGDLADCGIPTLVMHPINGKTPLPSITVGLDRFKKIVDTAERRGVNIAIENQGNPEYIEYVMRNINSDRLKFCYDSGHEKYYSPELDLISMYGDKLAALHLHDNNGDEDSHALPYTGKIDWDNISLRLKKVNYTGAIALETLNKSFEHISDPVEFLHIALERAGRIGE